MARPSGDAKLAAIVQVADTLHLTSGILTASGSGIVILNDDAVAVGASDASHIAGPVLKVGDDAFTFPVGRNGRYRPIGMSAPSSGSAEFRGEYFEGNSDWTWSHANKESGLADISRNEYWKLDRLVTTNNVSVTLSWDTATSCAFDTLANLRVTAYDTTGSGEWKNLGNGGTTGNVSVGTVVTGSASGVYGVYAVGTTDSFPCVNDLLFCGTHTSVDTIDQSHPFMPSVSDRFGNSYPIEALRLDTAMRADGTRNQEPGCIAGYYNIYFQVGSGMEDENNPTHMARRNAVCAVFTDLSDFMPSPLNSTGERVNVLFRPISFFVDNPSSSSTLGIASAYYVRPPANSSISGIIDSQIWVTINSGTDAYTNFVSPLVASWTSGLFLHGHAALNFENLIFNWNTGPGSSSGVQVDLYTVVLHEVMHALGFASLIDVDGGSKLGANFPYYSRYDLFLRTQEGQPLITNSGNCPLYAFGFSENPEVLSPDQDNCQTSLLDCDAAIEYVGAVTQSVHTPNCFNIGSSLSHFEDQCQVPEGFILQPPASNNLYFVMSSGGGPGPQYDKRYPRPEERLVLCDLGYAVDLEYGGTAFTSSTASYTGECSGLQVAGINDGLIDGLFAYSAQVGDLIQNISPLDNDFFADADENDRRFTCLEVILGTGDISPNDGDIFDYTPQSPGVHVLRYVPKNMDTENEGNITYIFVYAMSGNCEPSACNLVMNGGFEASSIECGADIQTQIDCWSRISGFARLHSYNCSNIPALNLPSSNSPYWYADGVETHNTAANGNEKFIGLHAADILIQSGMQTRLYSPLMPDEWYELSFWARSGNSSSYNDDGPILEFYGGSTGGVLYGMGGPQFNIQPSMTHVHTEPLPFDDSAEGWYQYTTTFQYSGTQPAEIFLVVATPSEGSYSVSPSFLMYCGVDDISLRPLGTSPTVTVQPIVCQNQVVSVGLLPPGGDLSGPGTDCGGSGCTFDADEAGVGQHTLTYVYTDPVTQCELTGFAQVEVIASDFDVTVSADPAFYFCNSTSNPDLELTASPDPASGGITYAWSPGGGTANPLTIPAPLTTTLYTVTATAPNGCIATDNVTVTVGDGGGLSVNMTSTPATCALSDGTATATPSGGTSPYEYAWDENTGYQTAQTATGLAQGIYWVTVEDANGCLDHMSVLVNISGGFTLTMAQTPATCDEPDGTATVTPSGGASPYTYTWDNSQTTQTATDLAPGTYTVTVEDANGCTAVEEVIVPQGGACCALENLPQVLDEETFPFGTVPAGITLTGTNVNIIANQEFTVNGTWTITEDLFLVNCNIRMAPNAIIIVDDNALLTIDGTHIHACEDMWTAIAVLSLKGIHVINGSIIEDAWIGLAIWPAVGYLVDGSHLNRNFVHMWFPGLAGTTPIGSITGSTFTCQVSVADPTPVNLLPPFGNRATYVGIWKDNLHALTVGAEDDGNLFRNASVGIFAQFGELHSHNNTFTAMRTDGFCNPPGPSNPSNFFCGAGIHTRQVQVLEVDMGNTFEHSPQGIYSFRDRQVQIHGNTFDDVLRGIRVEGEPVATTGRLIALSGNNMDDMGLYGIHAVRNQGATIAIGSEPAPNAIAVDPVSPAIGFGIVVEETNAWPATTVRVQHNSVTGAPYGIWTLNTHGGPASDRIEENTVHVQGAQNASGNPFHAGIRALGAHRMNILYNTVTADDTELYRAGTHLGGSGSLNLLMCNRTENIGIGHAYTGPLTATFIVHNTMEDNHVGLFLGQNSTLNDIGWPGTPLSNLWVNDPPFDTFSQSDASENTIYYSTSSADFEPEVNGEQIQTWAFLKASSSGGYYYCYETNDDNPVALFGDGPVRELAKLALPRPAKCSARFGSRKSSAFRG